MRTSSILTKEEAVKQAGRTTVIGVCVNSALAATKAIAGVTGNSYALVADAIESFADVFTSLAVYVSIRIAAAPPTARHPYGKGRAETIAAMLVALVLIGAAIGIAIHSVSEIRTPHHSPAPFTLLVLVVVIAVKEFLFRFAFSVADHVGSAAVKTDAWHHRSDAITSAAAFIGISVALIGGEGYESSDDWAALLASGVIAVNGFVLLKPALRELTDAIPDHHMEQVVRDIACGVEGVRGTHRCWIRKLGFDHYIDLDILVDGEISVREGHDLAHLVHDRIREALPLVTKVLIHVEPSDEFGRWELDGRTLR